MSLDPKTAAVLGDGAWGSAIALNLHSNGLKTSLWGPFPENIELMKGRKENVKFLPGVPLPEGLSLESSLEKAIEGASIIVLASPSQFMRGTLEKFKPFYKGQSLVSLAKGIENGSLKRMEELCAGGRAPNTGVLALDEFAAELKSGEAKAYSLVYCVNNVAPYAIDAIKASGFSVPQDFSMLCYGASEPCLFEGLQPDYFDVAGSVRPHIVEWLRMRLARHDRTASFRKAVEMRIVQGQTVVRPGKEMKP